MDRRVVFCVVLWMKEFDHFTEDLEFFLQLARIAVGMVRSFRLNFCTTCFISPRLRLIEERMPTPKIQKLNTSYTHQSFKKWGHLYPSSTSSLGVFEFSQTFQPVTSSACARRRLKSRVLARSRLETRKPWSQL